jgi:hypothetical protein
MGDDGLEREGETGDEDDKEEGTVVVATFASSLSAFASSLPLTMIAVAVVAVAFAAVV